MDATQFTTPMTPCGSPLPELEVPMVNTMARCLGSQNRKLDGLIMQLAFAATRLASDPEAVTANLWAVEVWDEIWRDLWSHLQPNTSWCFRGTKRTTEFQVGCSIR